MVQAASPTVPPATTRLGVTVGAALEITRSGEPTLNSLLVAGMCSNESPVKTELKASATSVYPLPATPMRRSANVAMPLLGFSSVSAKLAGPGLAPSAR